MTAPGTPSTPLAADEVHLAALGYGGDFHRSMSLWSNLALGFTQPTTESPRAVTRR